MTKSWEGYRFQCACTSKKRLNDTDPGASFVKHNNEQQSSLLGLSPATKLMKWTDYAWAAGPTKGAFDLEAKMKWKDLDEPQL